MIGVSLLPVSSRALNTAIPGVGAFVSTSYDGDSKKPFGAFAGLLPAASVQSVKTRTVEGPSIFENGARVAV